MRNSDIFDMPVGLRKMKRAEVTLLQHASRDMSSLGNAQLLDVAWALSTILTASQQGLRLSPDVFAVAESLAASGANQARP